MYFEVFVFLLFSRLLDTLCYIHHASLSRVYHLTQTDEQLMEKLIDFVLADFRIINERKAVASFIVSFMSNKGSVLLKE